MENTQGLIEKKFSEIYNLLKCCCCKKLVKNPLFCNQCSLFFCFECLKKLEDKCEICKNEIRYDSNQMEILKKISSIMNEIEVIKKKANKNENICISHPNNYYKYYCLNCNKNYCDECFVFFGNESDKHFKHDIFKLEELNKYNLICCINEYERIKKSTNEYLKFIDYISMRINELEFEKKIKEKELNEYFKNDIESQCNFQINTLKAASEELKDLNKDFKNKLSSISNVFEKIISRNDYNGSEELYEKLLIEKENIENIENKINVSNENIQFNSYEFPLIHVNDFEESFQETYQHVIPDCSVKLIINNLGNLEDIEFIVNIISDNINLLSQKYKVIFGLYNYNSRSFEELKMNKSIENHNDISFKVTMEKRYFTISSRTVEGDVYIKFYIF